MRRAWHKPTARSLAVAGIAAFLLAAGWTAQAQSAPHAGSASPEALALRWCAAMRAQVAAVPGDSALLLRSYDAADGVPDEPALRTAAFSYDNALAVIALGACGEAAAAGRIGEALLAAAMAGSVAQPQRLRNAYRAGPVDALPLPNGWWDAREQRWVEDAQQMGTSTGNVAWVGLALLSLHARDADPRWIEGARRMANWAVTHAAERKTGGFSGGVHGFDAAPQRLTWKSTEHNVDLAALFGGLAGHAGGARWLAARDAARAFVAAQWDADAGHFITGTLPDGTTPNRATSGLDAQLWPLLLPDAPRDWQRSLAYVERAHGVDGGFDFNADRDGAWIEGTAQAALAYRVAGREAEARRLLLAFARDTSASGYLHATRAQRITTGLALGPDSSGADFHYYRRAHLGATAWATLAALGWNPFALRTIDRVERAQRKPAGTPTG